MIGVYRPDDEPRGPALSDTISPRNGVTVMTHCSGQCLLLRPDVCVVWLGPRG